MATLEKIFRFEQSEENWSPTTSGSAAMWWRRRHHAKPRNNPWLGGCLYTSSRRGDGQTDNYWELSATAEDLGVPSGAIVTSVNTDYIYRFTTRNMNKTGNQLTMVAGAAKSGPFNIYDSFGTLLGTSSVAQNCGARSGYGDWVGWPLGYASDAIQDIPTSWGRATGSAVALTGANQSSNAILKYRIYNRLPPNANYVQNEPKNFLGHKTDRVAITFTFKVPLFIRGNSRLRGSTTLRG